MAKDETRHTKEHPPKEEAPTYTAGANARQNQGPPQAPPEQQSQKSQIAQYFKSQGRQPDDVIWSMEGLSLRLKDLD